MYLILGKLLLFILAVMFILGIAISITKSLWETGLLWVVLAGIAVLITLLRRQSIKRAKEQKRREEETLALRKRQEEEALASQIAAEENRKNYILSHLADWGNDTCSMLIDRNISIGMSEEMVLLSWGEPSQKEFKEATTRGAKTRWIFGVPRKGARYVWFTNGKITKIQG